MAVSRLEDSEIKEKIARLDGWKIDSGKIIKDFIFDDFVQAFQFMQCVAVEAEIMQHHPEWTNVYNRVHIALITHDAGPGLSLKDFSLAQKIDDVFKGNI